MSHFTIRFLNALKTFCWGKFEHVQKWTWWCDEPQTRPAPTVPAVLRLSLGFFINPLLPPFPCDFEAHLRDHVISFRGHNILGFCI